MSSIPTGDDVFEAAEPVLALPGCRGQAAGSRSQVHQQLRDGHLIALRRDGTVVVPTAFTESGALIKSFARPAGGAARRDTGTCTEILRWLFTPDPSLTLTFDGSRESTANARPVGRTEVPSGARDRASRTTAPAY